MRINRREALVLIAGTAAATAPSLAISPASVTLAPGETRIFTASRNVARWTATGGVITRFDNRRATYVAGANEGAFAVTAETRSGQMATAAIVISNGLDPDNVPLYGPRFLPPPASYVEITPGASIQTAVNANPNGTVFWLRAGTHSITGAITPKPNNQFIGELGAVIDGTGWTGETNPSASAFGTQPTATGVFIQNLRITNMPKWGISAGKAENASDWIVEYCEVDHCLSGVHLADRGICRYSKIHHCSYQAVTGGAYGSLNASNVLWLGNEISYCGQEGKSVGTDGTVYRSNYVHHMSNQGLWCDSGNINAVYENNVFEDIAGQAIQHEISGNAIIRNNTFRRVGQAAVFISTSHDVEIYGNAIEDCFRAINPYCNVAVVGTVGQHGVVFDLANLNCHDNTILVPADTYWGARSYGAIVYANNGDTTPYQNPATKNLLFDYNTYKAPDTTSAWFSWVGLGTKSFVNWQAISATYCDPHSTIAVRP